MFLKTLTLKGFKSFADPTTLQMEPGVTVVVGPNGSGKSNVVDAIAWVLGAQGPRVVRSSKMDDVIFAGTSSRPALGRAEVSLTIDNSARRLAIEFNEVTVTRTLFRSGESEYAINGVPCRLLDVQELLSDTGVGRQQHVIVGQGQLDVILAARPEERRMVIEEAAGVLKYRRRRERAERRLESSEGSLARLEDLVREVRRQIRPLERQAASARRHAELSEESRAVRLFLVGREIAALEQQLSGLAEASAAGSARRGDIAAALEDLDQAIAEQRGALELIHLDELDARIARGEQLRERGRGLLARCEERRRAQAELAEVLGATTTLERLESEQLRTASELAEAESEAAALAPQWAELESAEEQHRAEESQQLVRIAELEAPLALPGTLFAAADGVQDAAPLGAWEEVEASPATPAGGEQLTLAEARRQSAAVRERLAEAREAEARLAERATSQRNRHVELTGTLARLREAIVAGRADAESAAGVLAAASALEAEAAAAANEAETAWRDAGAAQQAARARVEALELALHEARARAGLERLATTEGVLGTLPDLLEVAEGAALALEAALEAVLDSILVRGSGEARHAVELLRAEAAGGAVLPVPAGCVQPSASAGSAHPPTCELLRPLVSSPDAGVELVLDRLLERVALCREGFPTAVDAALDAPDWTIVTLEGERFSATGWRVQAGRSGVTGAALEQARQRQQVADAAELDAAARRAQAVQRLDEARQAASTAGRESERLDAALAQLERSEQEAAQRVEELAVHAERSEAEALAAAQALREAGVELASADERLARLEESEREALQRRERAEREAARLREQAEQEAARRREEAARERRALEDRARALLVLRRDLEVRVAALEERRTMLARRAGELARQVTLQRDELELAEDRRVASAADGAVLARLASIAATTLAELDAALGELAGERADVASTAAGLHATLERLRQERLSTEHALGALGDRLQRIEVEQAEARVRHEGAVEAVGRDLGASLEEAMAAPEPPCPAGTTLPDHLLTLERELRAIGPVNPLAVEELTELDERHGFLQTQLEDVRNARRELREVIRAVDVEIVGAFADAFADVATHFSALVSSLFPGGEGRLVLTAPDDPLTTGVEIEARPPGRNVRRLSLLSGGERSLVALAFLFAVFRSRPSPFYVMDEVEAALDEVNLRRFLGLLEDFRDEAQLIVVSHQKKTMEIADALYGVTMQPGGASRVVSEHLRRADGPGRASGDPVVTPTVESVPASGVAAGRADEVTR